MRTLVIGLNWLGDAVMALPALHALRRRTRFDILAKPGVAPVYVLSGLADQVVLLHPGVMGVWRAACAARAAGYAQVYVMPRSWRAALIAWLAGIPRRVGLPGHVRNAWLTELIRPPGDPSHAHQQYEYLTLMGDDGMHANADPAAVRLPISDAARKAAQARLAAWNSGGPWAFLFPGAARGASKQWPKERFVEVGRRLIQAGGQVLVCGAGRESGTCQWVAATIGTGAVNVAGATSLADLAALLSCATVVVANDSGAMHLAAAVGTPVVAIFGLTDPAITGPLGMGHRILQAPGAVCGRDIPRRSEAATRALAAVSAASVSEAALSIMLNTEHMKIICATNMPFAAAAFGTLGETRVLEGRTIGPDDVRDADLLALRSTTKVDGPLLAGSRVQFVGTATIGTDHLDIPWLEQHGIRWCSAAGCNANSVGEYVVAALLTLGQRHGLRLAGRTLGVIGVGNVGRRVADKAAALGLRVLLHDPPRARAEAGQPDAPDFVPLDRLLAESDIVTLHVPLTRTGPDATWHLANASFFARLKPGAWLLNAARGPCVDSDALLRALDAGTLAHAALDTWEGEPAYRPGVMARMDLATPHIAGHSFEGKAMGTVLVYQQACRFLNVPERWQIEGCWPAPSVPEVAVDAAGRDDEAVLLDVVRRVYAIDEDDRRFRATAGGELEARREAFDRLRRDYPERREFRFTRVRVTHGSTVLLAKLRGLEFFVKSEELGA